LVYLKPDRASRTQGFSGVRPCAETVGPRHDHTIIYAKFFKRHTHSAQFSMKSSRGTVTLPFGDRIVVASHLVFDLDAAWRRLD